MTTSVLARMALVLLTAGTATSAALAGDVEGGQRVFKERCALCHARGGIAVLALTRRLGAEKAVLEERADLQPDYVRAVVRTGQLTMPPISRVEVTDAELNMIVDYLRRSQ